MTKKEWQRHMAYEALVILGMLALLLFVCRLWPILLLVILGIFAAALRLVFLSSPKVQPIQPDQQEVATHYVPQQAVTNREAVDMEDAMSFGDLQTQITHEILSAQVGKRETVLVESLSARDDGWVGGKTPRGHMVNFPGKADLIGRLVKVEILSAGRNTLRGRQITEV